MSGSAGMRPIVAPSRYGEYIMIDQNTESVIQEQGQTSPSVSVNPETSQNSVTLDSDSALNSGNNGNETVTENMLSASDSAPDNISIIEDAGNLQEQGQTAEGAVAATLPHTQQPEDASDDQDMLNSDDIVQMVATARNALDAAQLVTDKEVNPVQSTMQLAMDAALRAIEILGDQVSAMSVVTKEMDESNIHNTKVVSQAFNSLFGVLDDNKINEICSSLDIATNSIVRHGVDYHKDMKYQGGDGIATAPQTKVNETSTLNSGTLVTDEEFPGLGPPSAPTSTAAMALGLTNGMNGQQPNTHANYAGVAMQGSGTVADQSPDMTKADDDEQRRREFQQQVRLHAEELIRKEKDKERRQKNVIIKGLHETGRNGDRQAIEYILNYLGCHRRISEIANIDRLGNNRQGRRRCRLVIIEFYSPSAAYEVVSKAPKLMFDSFLGSVYIQEDLSREERADKYNRRRNVFNNAAGGAGAAGGAASSGDAAATAGGVGGEGRGGAPPAGRAGGGAGGRGGASAPRPAHRRPAGQTANSGIPLNMPSNDIQHDNTVGHGPQPNLNNSQGRNRMYNNMMAVISNANENVPGQEMGRNEANRPGNGNELNGNGSNQSGNGRPWGRPEEG